MNKVDPCGVYDKRVKSNPVLFVGCNKWLHQKCSGVKCSLKKVEGDFVRSVYREGW